ncbi:hypothetical protein ASPZODRAFT_18688 [Penicilliopsis zonata CBS 506.65]|uniref:DUF7580 domain-containing protein n=1 Tax=Penicilliopsis zonata CBS 506.65 TaxID=1073090 RepID=A0A1L9SBG9_9EURO|nr:hypothetical protein ASPZODRAFT_18688 [Penicilliopsis zonata CBS 506.65]OJJ44498.1 hypothetical protein ASPZODRAFT_18688 [Penicilliopsis zonata CBS 506.65]
MQTIIPCESVPSGTVPAYTETDSPPLQALSTVSSLMGTFIFFREIADCLTSHEQDQDLCATYRYLHVQLLLLTERVDVLQDSDRSATVATVAQLILKRFASLLRSSMRRGVAQSPSQPMQMLEGVQAGWGPLKSWPEKVEYLRSHLCWETKQRWEEVASFLEDCVDLLDAPSPDPVAASRRPIPTVNASAPISVYMEATLVFDALLASSQACQCMPGHEYTARLRLETYGNRRQREGKYAFNLMLGFDESYWQEILIHAALPEKKAKVRIVGESKARKRQGPVSMLVKKLCDHIRPQNFRRCLNMGVENGQLWKLQSLNSQMQLGSIPIRLERILEAHPKSLGDKIKRVLAVLLAHCIMHLYGTPWLQPGSFNSSNIIFLGTTASVPLQPFIHSRVCTQVPRDDEPEDEGNLDPDYVPLHPHPNLVMLAIMLIEIYMATPIRSFIRSNGTSWQSLELIDENSHLDLAQEAFQRCRSNLLDNYRIAVDRCLDV